MICAVIVAGGSGLRMKQPTRKQYLEISGIPILARTLSVFETHPDIDRIFVVIPEEDFDLCSSCVFPHIKKDTIKLVAGGKQRQDSVFNGIMALPQDASIVVIHDGVRPFVQPEKISQCILSAKEYKAAMLGIPVTDTLKQVGEQNNILATLERTQLWYAQTPQVFDYDLIRTAHEIARKQGYYATDDAALVEHLGGTVKMVAGDKLNIKITTPEDLEMAEFILKQFQNRL